MKIAETIYSAIQPLFKTDIKLLEVDYVKKNDGMHLVVFIDKLNGVTIDDCVAVNDLINPVLDELDFSNGKPYVLDVTSYGIDRPLKYDWQFVKYKNQKVNVRLYCKTNGRKEFVATLLNKDDEAVTLSLGGKNITIKMVDIASITPYIEF